MSMPQAPGGPTPGQGTAGSTDIVSTLQGVVRQLSNANQNMLTLIAALKAVNFPESVKAYTTTTLPASPAIGSIAVITNGAAALAWGANATAATGAVTYLVFWNGSQWSVLGK
jgi:hypothetical protein